MNMIRKLGKKLTAVLLAASVIMGASGSLVPALKVLADFSIDDTGFENPDILSQTVYYWQEGKPPLRSGNTESTAPIEWPVLIMWDGSYYVTEQQFVSRVEWDHNVYNRADESGLGEWYSEKGKSHMFPGPGAYYAMTRSYGFGADANKLDMNVSSLVASGHAVSFAIPDCVYLVSAPDVPRQERDMSDGSYYDIPSTEDDSYYAFRYKATNRGERYWLVPKLRVFSYGIDIPWYVYVAAAAVIGPGALLIDADTQFTSVDWVLEELKATASEMIDPRGTITINYQKESEEKKPSDRDKRNASMTITARQRLWEVYRYEGWGNNWRFQGPGFTQDMIWDNDSDRDYGGDIVKVPLSWTPNVVFKVDSLTRSVLTTKGNGQRFGYDFGDQFQLFYGEPHTMSFISSDFTVQNGQVTNLVGPVCIRKNVTATVEDGGVLTVTGWVLNNGIIKVEPGGTLIVQRDERTNSVLSTLKNPSASNSYSGGIGVDGTMIIMSGCTVNAAGVYGIRFGEGAQCVNYGALMAENMTIYTDHTIENRGASSCVICGFGIMDSGYSMLYETPVNMNFITRGVYEPEQRIEMPANAIYGTGSYRVYYNPAPTLSRSVTPNRTGTVSDAMNGKE